MNAGEEKPTGGGNQTFVAREFLKGASKIQLL
jgi:hypothetical protein